MAVDFIVRALFFRAHGLCCCVNPRCAGRTTSVEKRAEILPQEDSIFVGR